MGIRPTVVSGIQGAADAEAGSIHDMAVNLVVEGVAAHAEGGPNPIEKFGWRVHGDEIEHVRENSTI